MKYKKKKCCINAFYKLDLFIKSKKINQTKLIQEFNKYNVSCRAGSCPEIYREKIFKKIKIFSKNKRLVNAKKLGLTSLQFPINPEISLGILKKEINRLKRVLLKYI